jgi:hypothetical protein
MKNRLHVIQKCSQPLLYVAYNTYIIKKWLDCHGKTAKDCHGSSLDVVGHEEIGHWQK